ncbi:MAG: hypothetical protein A4E19_16340 [Nitrospira sp. SG-bin1]|nr:MAG: hypothetical protein A4E19_16340 [Nitrospira sp. SG-bin1]
MSLDSLRKLRTQTVETLMMELAQIAQALARSEERHRDIEAQIEKDSLAYDRQSASGLMIEAWLEWQGRMDSQQAALRQARREIEQAVAAWEHTKALLAEANQERKLLDLVADQRRETQRAGTARQEQRTMDATASRRWSIGKERGS